MAKAQKSKQKRDVTKKWMDVSGAVKFIGYLSYSNQNKSHIVQDIYQPHLTGQNTRQRDKI